MNYYLCLCHLLDQNFFGRPKSNFGQPKIISLTKNIKIVYKNEGPKNFGQPNFFLAGQKYFWSSRWHRQKTLSVGYDTYQSRDQKWTLYYNNYSWGWHLDLTEDLGKSLLHAPGSYADCPSYVGYNTYYADDHWTYFNPENNEFVQDDGLNFTCVCGKRSLLSSSLVVLILY